WFRVPDGTRRRRREGDAAARGGPAADRRVDRFLNRRDPVAESGTAPLDEAPATDLASLIYYIVKKGDTLLLIARKLHVNKADLADANYLRETARVSAGQKLVVPAETSALLTARADRAVPATEARRTVTQSGELARASANSNRVKAIYEVKRGDTLASIAKVF